MGKKIIMLGMAFIMCLGIMGGCESKTYESEYFYYIHHTLETSKEKVIKLRKLTEKGAEQKILIVPTKIKGRTIISIQISHDFYGGRHDSSWHSDNLEKVFFTTSDIYVSNNLFNSCPNMEKIIIVNFDVTQSGGGGDITGMAYTLNINYYLEYTSFRNRTGIFLNMRPANLSYRYNYETEINNGAYWIDDVDYGCKIEYIPENPEREGYTFEGWYKETECTTLWDFDTDTLPDEIQDEDEEVVYQETRLFAKWIKL